MLQQLQQRLMHTMMNYMTAPSAQQHRLEDRKPLDELLQVVLDSELWGEAAAAADAEQQATSSSRGAAHTSSSTSSGSSSQTAARAAAAAAAGGLSVEEQLHQATHCVVCLDALRDTLLLPCKHLVLCQGCSRDMQQRAQQEGGGSSSGSSRRALCPVCRVPVASQVPGIIMA
jgi:hypothetical protein